MNLSCPAPRLQTKRFSVNENISKDDTYQDKKVPQLNWLRQKQSRFNTDNILKLLTNQNLSLSEIKALPVEEQHALRVLNKSYIDLNLLEDSDMAIYILKKTVKNSIEYKYLQKVLEGLNIFKKNPELLNSNQLTNKLLNNLQYKHFEKHETIFEKDSVGQEYYIVLQGQIDCLINKQKKQKEDSEEESSQEDEFLTDFHREYFHDKYPHMMSVKVYQPGEAFGEIALLANCKRTATMTCRTEADVMTLSKSMFTQIMGEYSNNLMNKKVEFLKTFNFFRSVPTFSLLQLMHYIKQVQCRKNSIIYKEKDDCKFLYFVHEGEIQITQQMEIPQQRSENQFAKLKHNYQRAKIMVIGQNNFFGDQEIHEKKDSRVSQAECISQQAIIYKIKKETLFNFLNSKKRMHLFYKDLEIKYEFRNKIQTNLQQTLINKQQQLKEQTQVEQAQKIIQNTKENHFKIKHSTLNLKSPYKKRLTISIPPPSQQQQESYRLKRQEKQIKSQDTSFSQQSFSCSNLSLNDSHFMSIQPQHQQQQNSVSKPQSREVQKRNSQKPNQITQMQQLQKTARMSMIQKLTELQNQNIIEKKEKPILKGNLMEISSQQVNAKQRILKKMQKQSVDKRQSSIESQNDGKDDVLKTAFNQSTITKQQYQAIYRQSQSQQQQRRRNSTHHNSAHSQEINKKMIQELKNQVKKRNSLDQEMKEQISQQYMLDSYNSCFNIQQQQGLSKSTNSNSNNLLISDSTAAHTITNTNSNTQTHTYLPLNRSSVQMQQQQKQLQQKLQQQFDNQFSNKNNNLNINSNLNLKKQKSKNTLQVALNKKYVPKTPSTGDMKKENSKLSLLSLKGDYSLINPKELKKQQLEQRALKNLNQNIQTILSLKKNNKLKKNDQTNLKIKQNKSVDFLLKINSTQNTQNDQKTQTQHNLGTPQYKYLHQYQLKTQQSQQQQQPSQQQQQYQVNLKQNKTAMSTFTSNESLPTAENFFSQYNTYFSFNSQLQFENQNNKNKTNSQHNNFFPIRNSCSRQNSSAQRKYRLSQVRK